MPSPSPPPLPPSLPSPPPPIPPRDSQHQTLRQWPGTKTKGSSPERAGRSSRTKDEGAHDRTQWHQTSIGRRRSNFEARVRASATRRGVRKNAHTYLAVRYYHWYQWYDTLQPTYVARRHSSQRIKRRTLFELPVHVDLVVAGLASRTVPTCRYDPWCDGTLFASLTCRSTCIP